MNLLEWDKIARQGMRSENMKRTLTVKEYHTRLGGLRYVPIRLTKDSDGSVHESVILNGTFLGMVHNVVFEHWYMLPTTEAEAWEHLKPLMEGTE